MLIKLLTTEIMDKEVEEAIIIIKIELLVADCQTETIDTIGIQIAQLDLFAKFMESLGI